MTAINEVGSSAESPKANERTREAGKSISSWDHCNMLLQNIVFLTCYLLSIRLSINSEQNGHVSDCHAYLLIH